MEVNWILFRNFLHFAPLSALHCTTSHPDCATPTGWNWRSLTSRRRRKWNSGQTTRNIGTINYFFPISSSMIFPRKSRISREAPFPCGVRGIMICANIGRKSTKIECQRTSRNKSERRKTKDHSKGISLAHLVFGRTTFQSSRLSSMAIKLVSIRYEEWEEEQENIYRSHWDIQ